MKFKRFQFKIILVAVLVSLTGVVAFSGDGTGNSLDVFKEQISAKIKEWTKIKRQWKSKHRLFSFSFDLREPVAYSIEEAENEFYKLFQRKKIGFYNPSVDPTGKTVYLGATIGYPPFKDPRIKKVYDYCDACNVQRIRDTIKAETGHDYTKDELFKEKCKGYCNPNKIKQDLIRNHNVYYKALLEMALKEFKKSPKIFQGDDFKQLRAELDRYEKKSLIPPEAPVITQNVFDFIPTIWQKWHSCKEDKDCFILSKNCCGCLLDKYPGSDKTVFAVPKDQLGWSPHNTSLDAYIYRRKQQCLAYYGVDDSTCSVRKPLFPRPLTVVDPSCRRQTKKEFDEGVQSKFQRIIKEQIEKCKTGSYREPPYVSGSWCEKENYEKRIHVYYNKKAQEEIKKCEEGKGKEEKWEEWIAKDKRSICGGFKAKCIKFTGKCTVTTEDDEDDKDEDDEEDEEDEDNDNDDNDDNDNDDNEDKPPFITTLIYESFENLAQFTDGCKDKSDCKIISGNCCRSGHSGVPFAILEKKKEEYWKTRFKECHKRFGHPKKLSCPKTGKYDVKAACVNSKCVTQPTTASSPGAKGSR